ncbi:MAG TPA: type II secretion system protein [Candidatus Paceibacterota bacterium]|jgi:prepilin-type N-terminal cleavage/methylation domain-containing protein|nr:type II secretion system protein [Candidatus Paceibacterota bacterium]
MVSSIKYNKGFTLIEVLVVIGIIGLLIAAAGDLTKTFQVQNDIQVSANIYAQALRRAGLLSQAVSGDSSWGVMATTGAITLFKGSTFASRASGFDEKYPLSGSITFSGVSEVDFTKFTGLPSATGTTTITASSATAPKVIFINAKGTITY